MLVALFLASTGISARPLRVGIIGDQTYSTNLAASYAELEKAVATLNNEEPDVVLHTGDLVESSSSEVPLRAQYAKGMALLNRLHCPWHMTPGDHDVNPPRYEINSSDRSREALFHEIYRAHEPGLSPQQTYSFEVRGYHFICLNAVEHLHTDVRWGDVYLARLSAAQLGWLAKDLEQHRHSKGILVFLHQPLWMQWSNWASVHDLLRHYPVRTVIAGHLHYDQDDGMLDGIRYVTVGGTGAVLKPASRNAGGVQHCTLLEWEGKRVSFRLIDLDHPEPLQFTSRADMDRVQAVDMMRGELWKVDPICVLNHHGTVKLTALGNPIDVPLRIEISTSSDAVRMKTDTILLAPAARVQWSNNSTVQLQKDLLPAWEGGVEVPDSALDHFDLHLKYTFKGSAGDLFLESSLPVGLKACP